VTGFHSQAHVKECSKILNYEQIKFNPSDNFLKGCMNESEQSYGEIVKNLYPDYAKGKKEVKEFITRMKSR